MVSHVTEKLQMSEDESHLTSVLQRIRTPAVAFKTQQGLKKTNSSSHSLQNELKEQLSSILQVLYLHIKSSWLVNEGPEVIHNQNN